MQNKTDTRGELITWYLAKLRKNAQQITRERKLTPMTLVETDRHLIQELVMSSQLDVEQKTANVLETIQKQNKGIRDSLSALIVLTAIVAAGLFVLAFLN